MKVRHLKSFPQHTNYEEYKDGGNINKPHVAYCIKENEVHYDPYIIKTVSTVDATQFESLQYGFFWKGWQTYSQDKPVSIGWDDDTVGNHSVQPNNVAYFVPQYNFNNLYVYSQIPNTIKMEITFNFIHEFDEEFDVTINGDSIHSPISGTRYSLTLDGGDNTITIQSNSFPDIRVKVTEIKIYYAE